MDEIVRAAMARWPHVPDCFGWLGLDTRGDWYLRDDRVQAQGPFADGPSEAKGSRLTHEKLLGFIHRNYSADERGRWFFQNGPQRVFVELALTPWIWRLDAQGRWHTHTGEPSDIASAWEDEEGHLYLLGRQGIGLVHTADMVPACDWLTDHRMALQTCTRAELPVRFGFVPSPARQR